MPALAIPPSGLHTPHCKRCLHAWHHSQHSTSTLYMTRVTPPASASALILPGLVQHKHVIHVRWRTCVRAFAVKVEGKRLPDFPFSGLLKGCKGHKTHRFENGCTNQIRKTWKRGVVFLQPLPQTLYVEKEEGMPPLTTLPETFLQ